MKKHSKVWFASKISQANGTTNTFSAPEEFYLRENYLTIMPAETRGLAEVMKYGEKVKNTWTLIANARIFEDRFKIGDVFYLDGEAPNESLERINGYGSTANAVIKSVVNLETIISITLQRNQEQLK